MLNNSHLSPFKGNKTFMLFGVILGMQR